VAVVALGVVGGVGDDRAEAQAQREEHLRGRLPPHLHVAPDLQLGERGQRSEVRGQVSTQGSGSR